MASFQYAGLWGPATILNNQGLPVTNTPVTVYVQGTTTTATLYTDETMANTAPNPVTTDQYGNMFFFAAPGYYTLSFTVGGVVTSYNTTVNPWYQDIQNILNQQATDVNNITTLQSQLNTTNGNVISLQNQLNTVVNSLGYVVNVGTPGIDIAAGTTTNNVISGTVNYAGWYFVGIQFVWGTTSSSSSQFTEVSAYVYGPGVDGYGIGGGSHYTNNAVGGVQWPLYANAPVYFNGNGQVSISISTAGSGISIGPGAGWIVPITAQE
jgi:hypothetical protein